MLKAIHSQEDKASAIEKAKAVAKKLRETKHKEAAEKVVKGVLETLTYTHFPRKQWTKIHSNNAIETEPEDTTAHKCGWYDPR